MRNLTVDPNTRSANVSFTRPIGFVLEYLVQVAPNDSVHDIIFNERLSASDFDTDANAAISVLVPGLSPNTSYMVNVSAFSHHNQSEIMFTVFETGKYEKQTWNKNCAGLGLLSCLRLQRLRQFFYCILGFCYGSKEKIFYPSQFLLHMC